MDETESKRAAGQGFCLVMRLANPARLGELLATLNDKGKGYADRIKIQLRRLRYVHYSRFVPIFDRGVLLIVTEFDGVQEDYVMDFAMVLDEEFSFILSYMEGAPRLPVSRYPDEFYDYVKRNSRLLPPPLEDQRPFSAYPGKSVLDLIGDAVLPAHDEALATAPRSSPQPEVRVDWSEVQANVVQGLRALHALHIGLSFKSAEGGRRVVAELAKVVTWQAKAAEAIADRSTTRPPGHATNLGVTYDGLQFLEVPGGMLRRFPEAYRVGPANRADRLGDVGESAAANWRNRQARRQTTSSRRPFPLGRARHRRRVETAGDRAAEALRRRSRPGIRPACFAFRRRRRYGPLRVPGQHLAAAN
jgi:hypothetical protein